jgi:hypothetical protein
MYRYLRREGLERNSPAGEHKGTTTEKTPATKGEPSSKATVHFQHRKIAHKKT